MQWILFTTVLLTALHCNSAGSTPAQLQSKDVKYQLYYFNLRARAEPARLIFAQAGVPYEDVRVTGEEWPKLKPTTPFGHMPVLHINGEQLGESFAINRYLARQFDLAGKTPLEEAYVDSIADAFKDFFNNNGKALKSVYKGGSKEEAFNETIIPGRDGFVKPLVKFLKKANSGFVVGKSVTWADLMITEYLSLLVNLQPDFLEDYPAVSKYVAGVRNLPKIKAWIKKRPVTDL